MKLCPNFRELQQQDTRIAVKNAGTKKETAERDCQIKELLAGEYKTILRCENCPISEKKDPFSCLHINLPTRGTTTLHKCIKNFMQEEKMNTELLYPEILIIQMRRFGIDGRKVQTQVDFPLHLGEYSMARRKIRVSMSYSAVNHKGNSRGSGHYISQCRNKTNPSKWVN